MLAALLALAACGGATERPSSTQNVLVETYVLEVRTDAREQVAPLLAQAAVSPAAALEALIKKQPGATLLGEPHVLVPADQEATVELGAPIGLKISVTPHVQDGPTISMDVTIAGSGENDAQPSRAYEVANRPGQPAVLEGLPRSDGRSEIVLIVVPRLMEAQSPT